MTHADLSARIAALAAWSHNAPAGEGSIALLDLAEVVADGGVDYWPAPQALRDIARRYFAPSPAAEALEALAAEIEMTNAAEPAPAPTEDDGLEAVECNGAWGLADPDGGVWWPRDAADSASEQAARAAYRASPMWGEWRQ